MTKVLYCWDMYPVGDFSTYGAADGYITTGDNVGGTIVADTSVTGHSRILKNTTSVNIKFPMAGGGTYLRYKTHIAFNDLSLTTYNEFRVYDSNSRSWYAQVKSAGEIYVSVPYGNATSADGVITAGTSCDFEVYIKLPTTADTSYFMKVYVDSTLVVTISGTYSADLTFKSSNGLLMYGSSNSDGPSLYDMVIDEDPSAMLISPAQVTRVTMAAIQTNTGYTATGSNTILEDVNGTECSDTELVNATADDSSMSFSMSSLDSSFLSLQALQLNARASTSSSGTMKINLTDGTNTQEGTEHTLTTTISGDYRELFTSGADGAALTLANFQNSYVEITLPASS